MRQVKATQPPVCSSFAKVLLEPIILCLNSKLAFRVGHTLSGLAVHKQYGQDYK